MPQAGNNKNGGKERRGSNVGHPRILVVALSGIGNLLMQTPMIRALKAARPDADISVLVAPRGTSDVLERNADVSLILRGMPKPSLRQWLGMVRTLQRQRFDTGIVTYPGQLVTSASLLRYGNVSQRIGHRYTYYSLRNTGLFLSAPVDIEPVHDVVQNLNLLKPLGVPVDRKNAQYEFPLPPEDLRAAETFLERHSLSDTPLIGFHPGAYTDMDYKRWPTDRWIALGRQLSERYNARITIFGGPDENTIKGEIARGIGNNRATLVTLPLRVTAALMRRCMFFVSNDSGLMHVAVSQKIPTFGLFGPTDERRTAPWGPHGHVIRAEGTKPTYDVRTLNTIKKNHEADESLLALDVQTVLQRINSTMSS